MGAAAAFADEQPSWRVSFLRCCAANPSGPVTPEASAAIREEILHDLDGQQWDAVYLSLHGAMVSRDDPAPELTLLEDVRRTIGRTTLVVTFDLHANLPPRVTDVVDFAAGYKTYPHVDMRETAEQALAVAARLAEGGERPRGAVVKAGVVLPSFNMRTTDGPMAEMAAQAAALRGRPGICEAAVFGGFAYGDTPYAGAAAMVWTDGAGDPARLASDLADALRQRRARFAVRLPSPAAGLTQAAAAPRPAAVLDPADNPLSGGIADTPGLLRAVLDAHLGGRVVFAFFWAPEAVAEAHAVGVGGSLRLRLGARLTEAFGPGVDADVRIMRLTDGRFVNAGPMERGLPVALGRTAVVETAGVEIVLTQACRPVNDPAWLALHGIDLDEDLLLCVKAKNHFRAAFGDRLKTIIEVDAPGPATADLRSLSYRHLPPGIEIV
jgi:microcystin degradation protein MlrC